MRRGFRLRDSASRSDSSRGFSALRAFSAAMAASMAGEFKLGTVLVEALGDTVGGRRAPEDSFVGAAGVAGMANALLLLFSKPAFGIAIAAAGGRGCSSTSLSSGIL